ncbi:hypothetical protein DSO57_1024025 [Entomophthora muscae]|uniref:Uncharacterized protein n=1 Tax=Entomophthora muscae TaxID=34485 RepID=A0ACC2TET6_9FUNG|nr:hypothetical protein DSO57_1024025 [Entomophthora muscae]
MYLTLTGLIDSMVPASRPWALLGKLLSYIVKLAPILWWALPAGPAGHPPASSQEPPTGCIPERGPLVSSDKAMDPDTHIKDLFNRIIDIKATVYTSAYKTKMLELYPENAGHSPLPEFNIADHVLYYQHRVGGHTHKLDTLWIGPLEVTFKQGSEYTVKLLSSDCLFAQVYAKFLCKYYPPKANLEGAML